MLQLPSGCAFLLVIIVGNPFGGAEFAWTQRKKHATDNNLPLGKKLARTSSGSGTGGVPNSCKGGSRNYMDYGRSWTKKRAGERCKNGDTTQCGLMSRGC